MRADQLLLQQGLAPTRSAAQRLIERGAVRRRAATGWVVLRKAGEDLPDSSALEVTDDAELRFVSRGGLKLDAALTQCGIAVDGVACLDVGQSTGGFTDVLLQRGAAQVTGLDVGHGQLHPRIAADPRVRSFERQNARDVAGSAFEADVEPASCQVVVADLSFISLTLVLPTLLRYVAPTGHLLLLVKPQFELQPQDIAKGGLVKDASAYVRVEQKLRAACAERGLTVRGYFPSAIDGGDGNREFFVWAQPTVKGKTP